ncbi:DUF2953 domain-containing protein [Clostridium sp. AWRP]|uniref:DUF2953 domain-containing protein n=1 Tax=Clostridium sp. AWRP TaxID=2212991 RepID=UPI001585FDAF|nr:DUF2953 domain-containing protein [Clostridium sp. AWRP]
MIKLLISFILILFVLVFIPIPLKIRINCSNKTFSLKIYNLNVIDKINLKDNNPSLKGKKKSSSLINNFKINLKSLKNLKFKPHIKIKVKLVYGLDDAAYTAITYGLIPTLITFIFALIKNIFVVKKKEIHVKPVFNSFYFNLEISSIIYISLAKIIYMYTKLFKHS